jgi:glutaminyl-peptide cyclotransferase
MRIWRKAVVVAVAFVLLGSGVFLALNTANTQSSVVFCGYSVVNTYPHDAGAFTEGLVYSGGALIEGTGLYGSSSLRRVALENGSVLQRVDLPSQYFGEGITVVGDRILQLTWREHTGFVYDLNTLDLMGNFSFDTEGWGLTYDGNRLILSDGSSTLYFLDASSYQVVGSVQVLDRNVSIVNLNELEYVNGDVYANVWMSQRIVIINPQTGQVKGYVDLAGLQSSAGVSGEDVLNGIAYDKTGDRLFVTGKNWPQLYEIRLVPTG